MRNTLSYRNKGIRKENQSVIHDVPIPLIQKRMWSNHGLLTKVVLNLIKVNKESFIDVTVSALWLSLKKYHKHFFLSHFVVKATFVLFIIMYMEKNTRFWLAAKRAHCHVTRVQITNSAHAFKISSFLAFCGLFSCTLLTSNSMISLAIWYDKHL